MALSRKPFLGTVTSLAMIAILVLGSTGCFTNYIRISRNLTKTEDVRKLDKESSYLKAHMMDGKVYVLSDWAWDEKAKIVSGQGRLFDFNRHEIGQGPFKIPLDGVALFETNRLSPSEHIPWMVTLGVSSAILSFYCITNPKACFGSCPTFYVSDGENMILQAEGFSSSVARVLEARDIDALFRAVPAGPNLEVRLTNEAMETHVIRYADLLAVRRPSNGRAFVTPDGRFWQASGIRAVESATGPEGDVTHLLRVFDGRERFSATDGRDLASREVLNLRFTDFPQEKAGLVLAFRQTLLTTYLFYQGLAYLGSSAGYWFAQLERGDRKARDMATGLWSLLGGIEIEAESGNGRWVRVGEINETGPIATDVQVVPLPAGLRPTGRIRLKMARGMWRIDFAAIARLERTVDAIPISPSVVLKEGRTDEDVARRLRDRTEPLVTLPGDSYTLLYDLPDNFRDYELFLDSRGYYLEWMRSEWLKEEDPAKAMMIFRRPAAFLKAAAPAYKAVEPEMEKIFWSSKYVRTSR